MLTQAEYETLVRDFLVELNHLWIHEPDEPLQALPALGRIADEYLADVREQTRDPVQTLKVAFAYVDEFIEADRTRVMAGGYEGYLQRQRARDSS